MHILIGAVLGAAFAVLATLVVQDARGRRPTLKQLALAALGGAVSGAVVAGTFGAAGAAGVPLARQAVVYAAGGMSGSTAEHVAGDVIEGRVPDPNAVAESAALGAINGAAAFGVVRGGRELTSRALSRTGVPDWVADVAPGIGNAVSKGLERGARPLTSRTLREEEADARLASPTRGSQRPTPAPTPERRGLVDALGGPRP